MPDDRLTADECTKLHSILMEAESRLLVAHVHMTRLGLRVSALRIRKLLNEIHEIMVLIPYTN